MGLHKITSKAIRFNGFTDGIVVPTGQFKESGINLLRPQYAGTTTTTTSHATKIGRIHLPTETNPLNRILGPFTINAFILPNYGGTVVAKPKCFELKVGHPFKNAPIEFSIHCIGRVFTLITPFDVNALREAHSGTYSGGEHLPDDISEGAQPLMLITAQFTGDEMRLYVNTNLVASLNLIEQRVLDNVSSDLFIGGRGGEYRGIIESIRIDRGEITPSLGPLVVLDSTVGLWDFEDELDIPSLHFFNNRNEVASHQGRDGTGDYPSVFETPLVLLGYDFHNINDLGYFRVYERADHPNGNDDTFSALEKLASFATGIELEKVKEQTWFSSSLNLNAYTFGTNLGTLDYLTSDRIRHSTLNAVINQSGTHPITGTTKSASGRVIEFAVVNSLGVVVSGDQDLGFSNEADLDPMVNPIERVRITSLDFANNRVVCQSVHLQNDATTSATIENHPKGQGMLFDHADGTPIWLVLGNADLVLDPGNKETSAAVSNQLTRQKDAFTRAQFTQGKRFEDKSGSKNTAYFTSIQSRITTSLASAPPSTEADEPDPPDFSIALIMWLPVNALTGVSDGATVSHIPDFSGNKFGVYTVGTWQYQAQSANFNSNPSLKITSTDGALVNIDTTDGESEQITHSLTTNGFTAFWMMKGSGATGAHDLIGENATTPSTNKTFFGKGNTSDDLILTNTGATVTKTAIANFSLAHASLVSITFDTTTTNATIHQSGNAVSTFIGDAKTGHRFDNNLFALFGRALTTNASTKTGTASNKAKQNTELAEFLLYNRVLTNTERLEVQGYFMGKYGLI